MSPAPEVTVVIPTRNRARMVCRAIRSAVRQDGVDLEVVVVDDASTDGTQARIAALGDACVRLVGLTRRSGQARARNTGIAEARGKWVAFLDDDDVWAPSKLRCQLDAVAESPGAEFVYTGVVMVDEALEPTATYPVADPRTLASAIFRGNAVAGGASCAMTTRDLLERVGNFDERLEQCADWDLWIRLLSETSAACCPEPLIAYVLHPGNRLMKDATRVWEEFRYLETKHARRAREAGSSFDADEFADWIAKRFLRDGRRVAAANVYIHAALTRGSRQSARRALRSVRRGAASPPVAPVPPDWLRRLS